MLFRSAIEKGYELDFSDWESGGDWFKLTGTGENILIIVINCFGRFYVHSKISPTIIATERSEHLDEKDWYNEILDMIYIPIQEV